MRNLGEEETLAVLTRIMQAAEGAPGAPLRNTRLHEQADMQAALLRAAGHPGNRNANVTLSFWLREMTEAGVVEAFLVYEQAEQAVVHAELRRALGLAEVPEMMELLLAEVEAYFRFGELVAEQAAINFPAPPPPAPVQQEEEGRLGRRERPAVMLNFTQQEQNAYFWRFLREMQHEDPEYTIQHARLEWALEGQFIMREYWHAENPGLVRVPRPL